MRVHRFVLLCVAPLLFGGMCGSVLRRYDPIGWEFRQKSGAFERRVGDLQIELSGLVRQSGRLTLAMINHGASPVELRGVELRIAGEREVWTHPEGTVRVEPGAAGAAGPRRELEVVFKHVHEAYFASKFDQANAHLNTIYGILLQNP